MSYQPVMVVDLLEHVCLFICLSVRKFLLSNRRAKKKKKNSPNWSVQLTFDHDSLHPKANCRCSSDICLLQSRSLSKEHVVGPCIRVGVLTFEICSVRRGYSDMRWGTSRSKTSQRGPCDPVRR